MINLCTEWVVEPIDRIQVLFRTNQLIEIVCRIFGESAFKPVTLEYMVHQQLTVRRKLSSISADHRPLHQLFCVRDARKAHPTVFIQPGTFCAGIA